MKPDSNMETDRLLHGFARRRLDGSVPVAERDGIAPDNSERDSHAESTHLDADELIAYAENVLPVATRARYTDHLSGCDTCRKQVTDLVISSGVAIQLEAETTPKEGASTRSWVDSLSAMFAPRVLRYAGSVILLIGISAIAVMVFRGGREPKFTTSDTQPTSGSNQGNAPAPSVGKDGIVQDKNIAVPTPARSMEESDKADSRAALPDADMKDAPQDRQAEPMKAGEEQAESKLSAPATASSSAPSNERKDARDEDGSVDRRRQPNTGTDALDKNKSAKEAPRTESVGRTQRESASRAEVDQSSDSEGARITATKTPSTTVAKKSTKRNDGPSPAAPPEGNTSNARAGMTGGAAGKAEESRSVSGRQFVRRNGAWVDIAYRSQATTNLQRGSDQYRALVADNPGLRTIANQLGGVVIVVWNGRAYRIT